ncbi:hypothetical protein [Pseudonocardia sp. NPDC046786]|uniref:hypothetical protein n=1 Tax=Pseudonocardia sp. NPDC046786 TaxID=3155471 RepID=UPI0033F36ADC
MAEPGRRRPGLRRPPQAPVDGPAPAAAPTGGTADGLPRSLQVLASIVAPATLLTGLLLYFGRRHAFGFFDHFGVSYTIMDLTPADYLVRSADGMIPPLAVAGAAVLLGLWARQLAPALLSPAARTRLRRVTVPGLVLLGGAAAALTVVDTVRGTLLPGVPELRGLGLCTAALALLAATRLARGTAGPAAVTEWGVTFVLVGVGLFWTVGAYAAGVGAGRGAEFERSLPALPDAVLFSETELGLTGPGVTGTACGPDRFRYDGLKLVIQSGGQYLLLPSGWTVADGAAVLLPRTGGHRWEFAAAGTVTPGRC